MRNKLSGNRQVVGVILSLIVLGGAVAAGSALGMKDNTVGAEQSALATDLGVHTHVVYFMETEEAQGGATLAFEIKDFSFGVENPTTIGSATGGAGAGKIKFNEFQIKKTTDSASPAFFKNCASGAHYKNVTLEMRKTSDKDSTAYTPLMVFKFETVFVTKIDWTGPGDEGPEESITFVYGKLGIKYIGQTAGETTEFAWDQVTNRADQF